MAITDKTRKILWGRAGNRCAMCRRVLVVDRTPSDDDAVVGDECHIDGAHASNTDHDDLESEQEVALVGSFLQEVSDWSLISDDLEAQQRVQTVFGFTNTLKELHQADFLVFGAREIRRLEGGVGGPSDFPVLFLRVLRATNPAIAKVDSDAAMSRHYLPVCFPSDALHDSVAQSSHPPEGAQG